MACGGACKYLTSSPSHQRSELMRKSHGHARTMKTVEVIDLLSSPEPARRKARPAADAAIVAAPALSMGNHPAQSSGRVIKPKDGTENDEWLCISDDPDHTGILLSAHPDDASARNRTISTTYGITKASLKDEDSSSVKRKGNCEGEEDFFILSDDFDTTTDLGDPFRPTREPIAKRRKVVPKPEPLSMYPEIEKRKGITRSLSNVAVTSSSATVGTVKAARLKRSKTSLLDDDPIPFSSSPYSFWSELGRKDKLRPTKEREVNDDDDDHFEAHGRGQMASASTRRAHEYRSHNCSSDLDLPEIGKIASQPLACPSLSYTESQKTLAAYQSEKATLQKQKDKAHRAQKNLELREAEKEWKLAAKEAKAKEKKIAADLAKVNTLRIDKKVSTPEMIIDLPVDLDATLVEQVRQFLRPLDVKCEEWRSPIANVIKWRRKVEAVYNEEMGYWEPAPKQIKAEKHVMCVMGAKEFVDLTMADEGRDLDAHVLRMKARFHECSIIYLVEGLTARMRKNRNIKNRQFIDAVRSQTAQGPEESAEPSSRKGKKKAQQQYVDEDMIEDSLLSLQVMHGAQIHHTTVTVDTAQWITIFTQHISTIPYRLQQMTLDTAFCMESGQVKTGADAADTFVKMLQEINRVTAPIAYGIAARYPTAQKLVKGFESGGQDMLQGLKKSANKDGAFADRELGKKISRRLWGIFMGTDPGSTDI